jgi:hypothetical protein
MKIMPNKHPQEDAFEDYAFDRLSADRVADFEEHLLICELCQGTLARTDDYCLLMKVATAAYAAGGSRKPPARGLRRNAAAAAILLLTCLTALLSWRTPDHEPKTIALDAYRGPGASRAPAGQPLDLKIDLTDVRQLPGYCVEVVDTTGRRVWFGATPAHLSKGLPAGDYWVRLVTDSGELLREYGLVVGDTAR